MESDSLEGKLELYPAICMWGFGQKKSTVSSLLIGLTAFFKVYHSIPFNPIIGYKLL